MNLPAETIDAIKALRAMGARRVRIGDVEVEWSAPPSPTSAAAPRIKPEELERIRREDDDKLIYAASG